MSDATHVCQIRADLIHSIYYGYKFPCENWFSHVTAKLVEYM